MLDAGRFPKAVEKYNFVNLISTKYWKLIVVSN